MTEPLTGQIRVECCCIVSELIQLFDEIDIKSMGGNYWTFMNMLQPLFHDERTRERGMKLFRKVWDTFPQERAKG